MQDDRLLCTTCGHIGHAVRVTRGSFWVELVLWLCLLLPGLVYSVWRLATRRQGCAQCGAATLLPLESPVAQQFMRAHVARMQDDAASR